MGCRELIPTGSERRALGLRWVTRPLKASEPLDTVLCPTGETEAQGREGLQGGEGPALHLTLVCPLTLGVLGQGATTQESLPGLPARPWHL